MARHEGQEGRHGGGGSGWHRRSTLIGSPTKHEGDEFIEINNPELFPQDADSGFAETQRLENTAEHLDAYSEVFSPADVGRFIRPAKNYWVNHKAVVLAGAPFDPKHYPFDKLVAKYAGLPMIFDASNRHYTEYAGARLNLAVLRNYLGNHFYPDGPTGDEMKDLMNRNRLNQVAIEIGDMLHRGNSILPSLGRSLSPRKINGEGVGAANLYTKLLSAQRHEHLVGPFLAPIRFLRGKMDRDWRLPPLSETPFHPRNVHPSGQNALHGAFPVLAGEAPVAVADFGALDGQLAGMDHAFGAVEDLADPVKARAIELARDILKKLRIQFGDIPVAAMLDRFDGAAASALFGQLDQFSSTFREHLSNVAAFNPHLAQDADIGEALDALGILAHQSNRFALRHAEQSGDTASAQDILQRMAAMPAAWQNPGTLTLGQLSTRLSRGLEKVMHLQANQYGSEGASGLAQAQAVLTQSPEIIPVAAMALGQPQPNQAAAQAAAAARQAEALLHQQRQSEQKQSRPAKHGDAATREAKPPKPKWTAFFKGNTPKGRGIVLPQAVTVEPIRTTKPSKAGEPSPIKAPKIEPVSLGITAADLKHMQAGMMVSGNVVSPKRPPDHFKNAKQPDRDPSQDGTRQR